MEGPGKLHISPQRRWENPSLQNAISLTLVLGGSCWCRQLRAA